ncbi:MAG TPA: hypothetical protein VKT75_10330 [Acidobacteriaceae bacterium]|nr:hypothetical protein [Acidobacteriaceae bacterium]
MSRLSSGNQSPVARVLLSMKRLCAVAGAATLACIMTASGETFGHCGDTLDAPFHPHESLTIDSRPAGIEIVGTDKESITVTCTAQDDESAHHVKIRLAGSKLIVSGSDLRNGNLQIRVEVPRKTSLRVTVPAGEVKVEDVAGDKDIDIYAGQITISSTRDWDYRRIEASVDIGQVNASAYGVSKGGFFRSFTTKNPDGEYRLWAHVITGQIDLIAPQGLARSE